MLAPSNDSRKKSKVINFRNIKHNIVISLTASQLCGRQITISSEFTGGSDVLSSQFCMEFLGDLDEDDFDGNFDNSLVSKVKQE